MNFITISTIAALALYGIYIGVIPSISDSYRTVKYKTVYHIFFAVVGLLIMFQRYYEYKEVVRVWMFPLAAFYFWLIQIAPMFWQKGAGKGWHTLFTFTAIGIGIACIVVQFWGTWTWVYSVGALAVAGVVIKKYFTNPTLWSEYAAVLAIFIPLIQKP